MSVSPGVEKIGSHPAGMTSSTTSTRPDGFTALGGAPSGSAYRGTARAGTRPAVSGATDGAEVPEAAA